MTVVSTPKLTVPLISQILELGGTCTINGLSKAQFKLLASLNPELQMEREKNGKINIMASVKGDPYKEKAYIYRSDGSKEILEGFERKLSGEDVLEGFELDLKEFKLRKKKK